MYSIVEEEEMVVMLVERRVVVVVAAAAAAAAAVEFAVAVVRHRWLCRWWCGTGQPSWASRASRNGQQRIL